MSPIKRKCSENRNSLIFHIFQSVVEDRVCDTLLSVIHQVIYELCHLYITINWIWQDHAFLWFSFSHCFVCLNFSLRLQIVLLQCSLLNIYSTLLSVHQTVNNFVYFFALGRLAPYLERRWVRLSTPAVSSAPRMMW